MGYVYVPEEIFPLIMPPIRFPNANRVTIYLPNAQKFVLTKNVIKLFNYSTSEEIKEIEWTKEDILSLQKLLTKDGRPASISDVIKFLELKTIKGKPKIKDFSLKNKRVTQINEEDFQSTLSFLRKVALSRCRNYLTKLSRDRDYFEVNDTNPAQNKMHRKKFVPVKLKTGMNEFMYKLTEYPYSENNIKVDIVYEENGKEKIFHLTPNIEKIAMAWKNKERKFPIETLTKEDLENLTHLLIRYDNKEVSPMDALIWVKEIVLEEEFTKQEEELLKSLFPEDFLKWKKRNEDIKYSFKIIENSYTTFNVNFIYIPHDEGQFYIGMEVEHPDVNTFFKINDGDIIRNPSVLLPINKGSNYYKFEADVPESYYIGDIEIDYQENDELAEFKIKFVEDSRWEIEHNSIIRIPKKDEKYIFEETSVETEKKLFDYYNPERIIVYQTVFPYNPFKEEAKWKKYDWRGFISHVIFYDVENEMDIGQLASAFCEYKRVGEFLLELEERIKNNEKSIFDLRRSFKFYKKRLAELEKLMEKEKDFIADFKILLEEYPNTMEIFVEEEYRKEAEDMIKELSLPEGSIERAMDRIKLLRGKVIDLTDLEKYVIINSTPSKLNAKAFYEYASKKPENLEQEVEEAKKNHYEFYDLYIEFLQEKEKGDKNKGRER